MKKLYNEERDTDDYDNLVMKHMMAMTTEGLHSKVTIAVELAYRDWQIEQLREALQDFSDYVRNEQMSTDGPINYSNTQINRLVFKARKALEQTK